MKQGINFKLPIQVDVDLNAVDSIEFLFKQGNVVLEFLYPSSRAARRNGTNVVDLYWTKEETYLFKPSNINIDTRISMVGSYDQPETPILSVVLNPTLFEKEHSHD